MYISVVIFVETNDRIYSNKRRIWEKKVNKRHGPDIIKIKKTLILLV